MASLVLDEDPPARTAVALVSQHARETLALTADRVAHGSRRVLLVAVACWERKVKNKLKQFKTE